MTDNSSDVESIACGLAAEVLGAEPDTMVNPLTVLASPAWRGVEAAIWRASSADKSIILKQFHDDTGFYVDQSAAILASDQAGKLGVGPKVLKSWPAQNTIGFEDLTAPWRAGGLHDVVNITTRANVIKQKIAFQQGAKLEKSASIFEEIIALAAHGAKVGATLHRDCPVFLDFFADADARISSLGRDSKPCHRDGNTANLMVSPDGAVKLIDFDVAANCDPYEDIGVWLIEFFDNDLDARAGFEEWHGNFDEGLFQRAMLYGMADDLRWGLIGAIMAKTSPRRSLEFGKYASWRFLRLEALAKTSAASDRIRKAA